jgi:hypothetical protein
MNNRSPTEVSSRLVKYVLELVEADDPEQVETTRAWLAALLEIAEVARTIALRVDVNRTVKEVLDGIGTH